eukprot:gene15128-biopygen1547
MPQQQQQQPAPAPQQHQQQQQLRQHSRRHHPRKQQHSARMGKKLNAGPQLPKRPRPGALSSDTDDAGPSPMRGWTSYWCLGFDAGGRTRACVALLVRSPLLTSGVLQLRGQPQPAANQGPEQGRLLMLPLKWGRQPIDIVAVYLHAGDPAANVAIITGPLKQLSTAAPADGLIITGDFNFVHNRLLDRRSSPGQQQMQQQQQQPVQQQVQQQQQQ